MEEMKCDCCKKELNGDWVKTSGVDFEGCSSIMYKNKSFEVAGQNYCNLDCLMADIKKTLKI